MPKKIFLLFLFLFILVKPLWAEVKKVLIIPFEIYAQQDLSYMKVSIPKMIASRLFSPDKIEVIDLDKVLEEIKNSSRLTQEAAIQLGKHFQADYVIFGSITQLGETVSIDAQIVDLSSNKKPAQFYQEIKGLSEVIPQITRFARKTKLYIEGKEEDFYREDLALAYGGQPYVAGRVHPERGFYGYPVYPYPVSPRSEEPKVTRAKPRFGEDPTYEGLTKNLVIDLSGPKPVIGFAKEENDNATAKKDNQTSSLYYSYYPPQPYYPYSPPPNYYYYQQEESIAEKIWKKIWPFGEKEVRPAPAPIPMPVPTPIPAAQSPSNKPPSPQPSYPNQVVSPVTPQTSPPSSPKSLPPPQTPPPAEGVKPQPSSNNPWSWN